MAMDSAAAASTNDDDNLLARLPKVELHAHLNGCIRESTLIELAKERNVKLSDTLLLRACRSSSVASSTDDNSHHHSFKNTRPPRSLADCFRVFDEVGRVVTDLVALERIAREALEDFAACNVAYVELRTTPKRLLMAQNGRGEEEEARNSNDHDKSPAKLATKRDYLETVLRVMREFMAEPLNNLTCRLIVAMDRSLTVQEARENVVLAIQMSKEQESLVVGMDLGGNPLRGSFDDFEPLLQQARQAGLGITIHCAEVACNEHHDANCLFYQEAKAMLHFLPDRLGHALLLPSSLRTVLLDRRIPVETCPTSNVMTLELHKHEQHSDDNDNVITGLQQHGLLRQWLDAKHPLAIGTDDPGVFDTNATQELQLLQRAMALTVTQVAGIVLKSMDFAFCSDVTKARIKADMAVVMTELGILPRTN